MEFISAEAKEYGFLVFSDDEEHITDDLGDFIDDSTQPQEDVSFYRTVTTAKIIRSFLVRHVILWR